MHEERQGNAPRVHRVLIIEDDQSLTVTLRYNLRKHDYLVTIPGDRPAGINSARQIIRDDFTLELMITALGRAGGVIAGLEARVDEAATNTSSTLVLKTCPWSIRARLKGEPDESWLTETVHGVGYRFAGELGPNVLALVEESEGRSV